MNKLEETNRKFFNQIAKRYNNRFLIKPLSVIKTEVIKEANLMPGSKILDIGCGTGEFLLRLSIDKSLKLYGIDISEKMLDIAEKKLKNTNAKLKLVSIEKFKFRDNFFDYVFIIDVFHHFSKPEIALKNIKKILKKNGKLIIADINFGDFGNKIFHLLEPGNSRMFTKNQVIILLGNHNFYNIKYRKVKLFSNIITAGKI